MHGLGLECVEYRACKADITHAAAVNPRMEALNRVLKQLHPKTSPAGPLEVLAVLDDDQARAPGSTAGSA